MRSFLFLLVVCGAMLLAVIFITMKKHSPHIAGLYVNSGNSPLVLSQINNQTNALLKSIFFYRLNPPNSLYGGCDLETVSTSERKTPYLWRCKGDSVEIFNQMKKVVLWLKYNTKPDRLTCTMAGKEWDFLPSVTSSNHIVAGN